MDYILNRVNYQTLIMMLSDAPRYVRDKSSGTDRREKSAEEEAGRLQDFIKASYKDGTGKNRIPDGGQAVAAA